MGRTVGGFRGVSSGWVAGWIVPVVSIVDEYHLGERTMDSRAKGQGEEETMLSLSFSQTITSIKRSSGDV
jgi:hypothetical protein